MKELDHTIVYVEDTREAVEFYTNIVGFESAGRLGSFEVLRVNDHLSLDLVQKASPPSMHYAFVFDAGTFSETFDRIRTAGISYGDGPGRADSMIGPGRSTGTRGTTYSVYFRDPSGHMLEIITYEPPA